MKRMRSISHRGKASSGPVIHSGSDAPRNSDPAPKTISFPEPPQAPLPESAYEDYRALVGRTIDVFGDPTKASRWLSAPNHDLNGKAPLQLAREHLFDPAEMQRIFEPIFVRIEHGVYW